MADWANLNGQRIVSANILIPYYGAWVADAVLSSQTSISSANGGVTLTVGDISLIGTVYRQFSFSGSRSARVVGGFGGWQDSVQARAYQNPGGVLLSTVLGDLASDTGEMIDPVSQAAIAGQTVGSAFTREAAPALRILKQLTGIWWIDSTGFTQVIDRATMPFNGITSDTGHLGAITSSFNVIDWSGAKGKFRIATETVSDWMPGRTFSSPTVTTAQTVSLVTHLIEGGGKHRTEVLTVP